jgi:hypothetical protein
MSAFAGILIALALLKFTAEWDVIHDLHGVDCAAADRWMAGHVVMLGKQSTLGLP